MSVPMEMNTPLFTADVSRRSLLTGRVLSTLAVLFLLFDAVGKLLRPVQVVEGTTQLGWPASVILPLGIVQLVLLALYVVPRTSLFGAILWTGYLGGAVATHVRIGNPLFSHILFPTYVAALLWVGLWLRDRRLRALLPLSN
ncbi:MAG TPA: DoxX family protein [Thermoanaerobaculia bacterium]|jgi:hypothetical protein